MFAEPTPAPTRTTSLSPGPAPDNTTVVLLHQGVPGSDLSLAEPERLRASPTTAPGHGPARGGVPA
ncbi:hypothetical protein GCM10010299_45070 [Streptomyces tanashiensis]|nr:hypothetical protein GCM10010299_45070 [Streptomyces tanashiensis]